MVLYNFKTIAKVPTSKDFIDIILSKTQRKTPTVVHKGWAITRIRSFYMRKVKFTQSNYHDRLAQIVDEFPRLDDIHPFYADLINVLYSRDHYKLALGQMHQAMSLIDNVSRDYLRMLKYADSLYRSKELKKAALGRMCTIMKKMSASLLYLEQVRQHLSRLPSIDPNTRTLMITGYPNVGKSSFINKISRANVDVQPYAFTTKSLFIGHTDYKYVRWQAIDTPGILDHPLEERNTIEMQAITALAHLNSTVLYFIDISETCGYTIKQQVSLYHNIKPLFMNKPLLIVCNKTDLKKWEDVDPTDRDLIDTVAKDRNTKIMFMSNASEIGIGDVKAQACEMLLAHRVERKLKGKRINDVINRIHVAQPVKRDNKARPTSIPLSVLKAKEREKAGEIKRKPKTEKDIELEHGGPGIYNIDLRKFYDLPEDWKYDVMPSIMDGKNIADFIDPEIEAKLAALEEEEERLLAEHEAKKAMADDESDLDEEDRELVDQIRTKRKVIIATKLATKTNNKPKVPRRAQPKSMKLFKKEMKEKGLDADKAEAVRTRATSRSRKRTREVAAMVDDEEQGKPGLRKSSRSKSRQSRAEETPKDLYAYGNLENQDKATAMVKKMQRTWNSNKKGGGSKLVRDGPGDRHVYDVKPKHLYSGKIHGQKTRDYR